VISTTWLFDIERETSEDPYVQLLVLFGKNLCDDLSLLHNTLRDTYVTGIRHCCRYFHALTGFVYGFDIVVVSFMLIGETSEDP